MACSYICKIMPIMLALCLMLLHTYYAKNYAGIIDSGLKGVHRSFLPSYLDEFMWQEKWGGNTKAAFNNIVSDIATQYPLPGMTSP